MAPPLSFAPWGERISAFSFPHSGTQRCPHLSSVTQQGWSQDPGLGLLIQCSAHGRHPPASGPVTPSSALHLLFLALSSRLAGSRGRGTNVPRGSLHAGHPASLKVTGSSLQRSKVLSPTEQRRKLRLREAECLRSQAGKRQSWDLNSCSHGGVTATSGTLIWTL